MGYRGFGDFTLLLVLFAVIAAHLAVGFPPTTHFAHDTIIPLDGAWRILQGQKLHVDFFVHSNDLYYLLLAGFMRLFGAELKTLLYLHCFLMALLTLIAMWIVSKRFSLWATVILVVVHFSILAGFAPLGTHIANLTYAEFYNKIGWSILFLVMLVSFRPRLFGKERDWAEGILCGFFVGALFLLKASYFGVGVGAVALGYYLEIVKRRFLFAVVVGFATTLLLFSFHLGWGWSSYAMDQMRLFGGYSPDGTFNLIKLMENGPVVVLLSLLLFLKRPALSFGERLIGCFILISECALLYTNSQVSDLPNLALIPFLCLFPENMKENSYVPFLLAIALSFHFLTTAIGSIFYPHSLRKHVRNTWPKEGIVASTIAAEGFGNWLVLSGGSDCNPTDYAARLNEGFALIKANSTSNQRVSILDFSNPFSFALRRPPPKGGALVLHLNNGLNKSTLLPPERFFSDTDVVIIPKCPEAAPTVQLLTTTYGDYLRSKFPVEVTSESWVLKKRN